MGDTRLQWREMLPIVERELRVASKRRVTYRLRWTVAILGGLEVLFATQLSGASVQAGKLLFWCTAVLMLLICGAAGLLLTADSISREKRDGTLGLLFLTRIGSADVVLGKLTVGALSGGAVAFAGLPFLAFSLCLGGVTAREFWTMSAALLFLLAYSLVLGIFVSTMFRKEGVVALAFCAVMWAPLIAVPYIMMKSAAVPEWLIKWNAFYPALTVMDADASYFTGEGAWAALMWQTLVMFGMLGLSFFILPWTVRVGWTLHRKNFKPLASRSRRRSAAITDNPMLWLSRRDHRAWALLALCIGLYLVVGFSANSASEAEITFMILMAFLPKLFVLWQASGGMAAERQSGFLEALLTTPISRGEVLRGKMRALRRQIAPALIFSLLALWHISTKWWGAQGEITLGATIGLAAMIALLIDVHAIGWIGLWQGLLAKDRRRALVWAAFWGLIGPWLPAAAFYFFVSWLAGELDWVSHPEAFLAPAMISANVASIGIACFAMARLHEKFRASATQTWSRKLA